MSATVHELHADLKSAVKIETSLVCTKCGAPGEGSCQCGAPYVSPSARAEAAVKANPLKSDRAIAKEIGSNPMTVGRARKSTVTNVTVEKRIGQDGKARRPPRPSPEAKKVVIKTVVDEGRTINEAAEAAGVSHWQAQAEAIRERARREAIEAGDAVDLAQYLSASAQVKLEVAVRQYKRKLDAEHAVRLQGVAEEIRIQVIERGKAYLEMVKEREAKVWQTEKLHQEFFNRHKPPFTTDEFKAILMCLHPDGERTAEKLSAAFQLFNAKKLQMTGKR